MGLLNPSIIVQFLILFSLHVPALATKKPYIVYLGSHTHGPEITEADLDRVADSHHEFLGSFLGSKEKAKESIFISYDREINGFASLLEEEEAAKLLDPKVVSVFEDRALKLHTTRSWGFMMLEDEHDALNPDSIWAKARFGEDTIIGNIDTGVWPTSKSFQNEGYGPIPSRWKGSCEKFKDGFTCNRKLIGARYSIKGYESWGLTINSTDRSPRDHEGHGSHTLSTAAGNFVPGANIMGEGKGTAKGGAPRARAATYKACWPPTVLGGGCIDSDILNSFDMAIHDGVDVISISVGGYPSDYWGDALAIGAFHATKKGIVVVASAGNEGPYPGSVTNIAPWIITVAASSTDREFQTVVELQNGLRLKGLGLSHPLKEQKFYPLITGAQARLANASSADASGALDPAKVRGKILACEWADVPKQSMGENAALAGAVGLIICNSILYGNQYVFPQPYYIPTSHLSYDDSLSLLAYVASVGNPQATLSAPATVIDNKPAPVMAFFSSVGPNTVTPEILKPDITAPGVNILAAYAEDVSLSGSEGDTRKAPFNVLSGTSMSCPHVAGVAGLLKTIHRDWSPAAIRSAIVTTARTRDNTGNATQTTYYRKATPFDYGHGHIRPNQAMDPGLVYDLTTNDYLTFLCSIGYNQTLIKALNVKPFRCPSKNVTVLDFNYPSVTVPNLNGSVTLTRTVKNVGTPGTYVVRVREPVGVSVSFKPRTLKFEHVGEEKSFRVTLKDKGYGFEGYRFGGFVWSDGKHDVRSPIVVQITPPKES